MKPVLTFPFTVITMPPYWMKIQNGQRHGRWPTLNPWIQELQWANEMAGVNHGLRATLWGSDSPWRADEAFAAIAEASNGVAQDPTLEAAMPEALGELQRLFVPPPEAELPMPVRVLFPALSASWNRGIDVSVEADPYRRRNSLGRRLAMAVYHEFGGDREPILAAARLFPCTCSGDEYPHDHDTLLLQIHR